ncbi:MAG: pyridoxal 5'-phosphate synthase glutaminase subunit PdxT [Mycobacteriales bacterium]
MVAGPVRVGVLALQGDVREHVRALSEAGADPVLVRRSAELASVAGLVLPGGESTAIIRLATRFDLLTKLREFVRTGGPVLGSCAGLILLADRIVDGEVGQEGIGGLDVTVRRNAFGRQVDSFETDLDVDGLTGGPLRAVFIRAPCVEEIGPDVSVLAQYAGKVVAVRQGGLVGTAFHPEISGDGRVHAAFVRMVQEAAR